MATEVEDINTALSEFGLNEAEVSVYQAILALGPRPASVIAQKAGLKRGRTYNVLGTLMHKGIVQEFTKNSVRYFTCGSPTALLSILENRKKELEAKAEKLRRVLPQLEQLRSPATSQPRVRYFRGVEGVKEVFEDMLRVPQSVIYGLLDLQYSWSVVDDEQNAWLINSFIKKRDELNIWYYGIANESEVTTKAISSRPSRLRKMKRIRGLKLPIEINIYGRKVAVISTFQEAFAFIIEDPMVADSLRDIHQKIWPFLEDYTTDLSVEREVVVGKAQIVDGLNKDMSEQDVDKREAAEWLS